MRTALYQNQSSERCDRRTGNFNRYRSAYSLRFSECGNRKKRSRKIHACKGDAFRSALYRQYRVQGSGGRQTAKVKNWLCSAEHKY